jgi:endonuclease/exonuclease/phosphatase family metal-dependent hydrolase
MIPMSRRRCLFLPLSLLLVVLTGCIQSSKAPDAAAGEYLFCFWTTENFFDYKVNGWNKRPAKEFDRWFAEDKAAFEQKLSNLTEVLAALNEGKGPDILALAEVEAESEAASALMASLNKKIKEGTPPYLHILKKNPHGGRDIVTAIITRLPVVADRTQLLGKRQRILEGHIVVDGRDLTVVASHWTSRVSDKEGKGRERYANQIYGRFRAMYKAHPEVSFLVCGDFNDNPDDASVKDHLHATGVLDKVKEAGDPPLLYDVFAPLWAENKGKEEKDKAGTHFYRGRPFIIDHIVVSPGMVDGKDGWQCDVKTAEIVKHRFVVPRGRNKGHALAFGTEREKMPLDKRGASDHLPVTVRLKVTSKN